MNEDPALTRVALRKGVLPALEQHLGRNVRPTLARSAMLLRRDADFLDHLAEEAAKGLVDRGEGLALPAAALSRLGESLSSRVIRRLLLEEGLVPTSDHIAAILALATARSGAQVQLPAGLRARRDREYVRVSRLPSGSA